MEHSMFHNFLALQVKSKKMHTKSNETCMDLLLSVKFSKLHKHTFFNIITQISLD